MSELYGRAERCWNCGSERYYNTARIEECPDCGIKCDYHGGGANAAYDAATAKRIAAEQLAELYASVDDDE